MVWGKGLGKTTRAIQAALNGPRPAVIVTINQAEKKRIEELLKEADYLKRGGIDVITFDDLQTPGKKFKNVILDNADHWIFRGLRNILAHDGEVKVTATGRSILPPTL